MTASLSTAIGLLFATATLRLRHLLAALKLDAFAIHTVPLVSGSWEALQIHAEEVSHVDSENMLPLGKFTFENRQSIAQIGQICARLGL